MEQIRIVEGVAAPLLRDNVDTDTISPGQRRSQVGKPRKLIFTPEELSSLLFSAWRYDEQDQENPEFVLNQQPYRTAKFLLTGKNFGCGSSRETAAEMFFHFGIRCIIAESFSEIFYGNCVKNSVVPVVLQSAVIQKMVDAVQESGGTTKFRLDLDECTVSFGDEVVKFQMPNLRQRQLLEGLDEIEMTRSWDKDIQRFQNEKRASRPWDFF